MKILDVIVDYWAIWTLVLPPITAFFISAMKKLNVVYQELTPNGGTSIKDQVNRVEAMQQASLSMHDKAYWTSNPQGECVFASPRLAALMGGTPGEIMGWGWTNFIHPDDAERVRKNWEESVEEHRDFFMRFRYRSPHTGEITTVDCRATPAVAGRGENRKVVGIIGWSERVD